MDISELIGSGDGDDSYHGNSSNAMATKHFTDMPEFVIPTMIMYTLFSVVGTVANIVIIITICINKRLHSVTNVFITLLAVGDLCVLVFCMPFTVSSAYFFKSWIFGYGICFMVKTAGCMGATISVCTLCVVSYERFIAIMKPIGAKIFWSKCKVFTLASGVILVALCRAILRPAVAEVYHTYYDDKTGEVTRYTCSETPGTTFIFWYGIIGVTFFYAVVLVTIGLLYRQIAVHLNSKKCMEMAKNNPKIMAQRKRIVRMLIIIVILFALCWTPVNIIYLMFTRPEVSQWAKRNDVIVFVFFARILEYGNCVANPFLYSFLSTNFTLAFIETWGRCFPFLKRWEKKKYTEKSSNSAATVSTSCSEFDEKPKFENNH